MIFDFLRERVSQASEPAHVHPHVEVLPFHVAGADVFVVRGDILWPSVVNWIRFAKRP